MPEKGKLPAWEREDNRANIFTLLLEKSLTFGELLDEVGLSRSTLSGHLSDLQQDGLIEKAIKNNRVVYQTTLDAEKIEAEFKKLSYDMLVNIAEKSQPGLDKFLKILMVLVVKFRVLASKRKLEGKPELSFEELPERYRSLIGEELGKTNVNQDHLEILSMLLARASKEDFY